MEPHSIIIWIQGEFGQGRGVVEKPQTEVVLKRVGARIIPDTQCPLQTVMAGDATEISRGLRAALFAVPVLSY